MQAKLTKRTVEDAEPAAQAYVIWDTVVRGFGVKVNPTGSKSYLYYYRTESGRQRKPTIGRHGALTVEQARATAKNWSAQVALGIDISGQRQDKRRGPTFSDLAKQYLSDYAKVHKKPRSVAADRSILENHLNPLLGRLKVTEIKRSDLEQAKLAIRAGKTARIGKAKPRGRKVVRGGPVVANRAMMLLSKMFNCAIDWGIAETNPAQGIKKFRENRSDRFLDADEMARTLVYFRLCGL